jgi:hypothetical protein
MQFLAAAALPTSTTASQDNTTLPISTCARSRTTAVAHSTGKTCNFGSTMTPRRPACSSAKLSRRPPAENRPSNGTVPFIRPSYVGPGSPRLSIRMRRRGKNRLDWRVRGQRPGGFDDFVCFQGRELARPCPELSGRTDIQRRSLLLNFNEAKQFHVSSRTHRVSESASELA